MFPRPHQSFRALDPIPARAGIGLKGEHMDDVLETRPDLGWFEVHPENYMNSGGILHDRLEKIRALYPLSLHGVGLSLGTYGPLDRTHLLRLKELEERYQPGLVSEHLAWCRYEDKHFNDLLPLPLTQEALDVMIAHVDEMQDVLGRQVLIENPSSYISFDHVEMNEPEFLAALAYQTGCGLLLDINNVYVSAQNHGFDAVDYLRNFPAASVQEIHLAGHALEVRDGHKIRIDDHGSEVSQEVWQLYRFYLQQVGPVPTLIEWDTNVPALSVLLEQAALADVELNGGPLMGAPHGAGHGVFPSLFGGRHG
ncbi:MAG: DUF692 domain-containing protein [Parvibaculaceae bacterium]|nr:DUF692 domain-containing protein [Parvibaculaceae bacterium]